jgi:hypothetical protein
LTEGYRKMKGERKITNLMSIERQGKVWRKEEEPLSPLTSQNS